MKTSENLPGSTKHLITENEIVDILGNELPEINPLFERSGTTGNVYKVMQTFADFTKQLVSTGNLKEVKHCFTVAEKLIREGNNTVKNSIENCYLFSVSIIIDFAGPLSNTVKNLMGGDLRKEYNRQISCSGI